LVVNIATNETISQETFTYDAAGNIIGDNTETTFVYDTNNRLTSVGGQAVTYDLDGNMLSCGTTAFTYDSSNRLITAGGNTYTYNAEDIRVRNLCGEIDTTYAYNTNARLSQLLQKTTNGVVTKYVYGVGLIGEETGGIFKTYHFDMRGSTTAITDMNGNVTDTFKYDTYGKLLSRTGTSDVIFLYNGRDGVVTDSNGLLYMRARYYSPVLRRFINADILHGEISDSTSLNRYAYVNGNPVSFVDPFGMSAERHRKGTANFEVFYGLERLYNFAYRYYSFVPNEGQRMRFANDAAMKFIIYKKYYTGNYIEGKKKMAWEFIAGQPDYGAIYYLESCVVCHHTGDGSLFVYDHTGDGSLC